MLGAELNNAAVYTDFQGFASLRREAQQNSEQALEKTARQFEALFVQMMLKSMREAGQGEGLFDNDQSKLYRDMYDKQLSLHLTEQGEGVGLAKMLVQQLRAAMPKSEGDTAVNDTDSFAVPARGPGHFELSAKRAMSVTGEAVNGVEAKSLSFESPEHFIRSLAPYAEKAAQRLGVDPKALLAQAALETGWGKAVIRHPDGNSSHNLFNIKADSRWQGERVAKQTLEYRQGIASKEVAHFRSYGSLEESFHDYAAFLQNSPRYAEALQQGKEADRYVEALQDAGYATDPAYAQKIKRIMHGDVMASADELKVSDLGTLS